MVNGHKDRKMQFLKRVTKIFKVYLIIVGIACHIFVVWMLAGWPIFIDRLVTRAEAPVSADAVVCLAGGISHDNLPTQDGWQRIYTAVQLYFDGYAPKIIFTGGGSSQITEAEIYAECAVWLGCPKKAIAIDPFPSQTSEHPQNILRIKDPAISTDSILDIVTTPLHSKRAGLCFKKAGFKYIRVIVDYSSQKKDPAIVRSLMASRFKTHEPSGKVYNDVFRRLKYRSGYFFETLREIAAILYYKIQRYI